MKPVRSSVYRAHELVVAPARAYPQVWRLLIGIGIVVGVSLGLSSLVYRTLLTFIPASLGAELVQADRLGGSPVSMLILMSSFLVLTFGVLLAARLMQHRSLASIIGPLPLAISQFTRVLAILAGLGLVLAVLPPYGMERPLEQNMKLTAWLMLLPVSIFVILIQTSAEEILFRGYIQQSLAARFSSPLVWMVLPSALFAYGHYMPAEAGENALILVAWAGIFGLFSADLTARSGTLGPAIALHLFNNASALLFVALPDSLSGLALYLSPFEMSDTAQMRGWLMVDFGLMAVGWLAARLALRR